MPEAPGLYRPRARLAYGTEVTVREDWRMPCINEGSSVQITSYEINELIKGWTDEMMDKTGGCSRW